MARLLMAARDAFIIGAFRDGHSSGEIARAFGWPTMKVVTLLLRNDVRRGPAGPSKKGFSPTVPPELMVTWEDVRAGRAADREARRLAKAARRKERADRLSERDKAACAIYARGHSMADVATAFGVNIGTVSRIVARRGVRPHPTGIHAALSFVPCVVITDPVQGVTVPSPEPDDDGCTSAYVDADHALLWCPETAPHKAWFRDAPWKRAGGRG